MPTEVLLIAATIVLEAGIAERRAGALVDQMVTSDRRATLTARFGGFVPIGAQAARTPSAALRAVDSWAKARM